MLKMVIDGRFVEKHEHWAKGRYDKNYIAEITGLHPKFTFNRKFLNREKRGRAKDYLVKDFLEGHYYEIVSKEMESEVNYKHGGVNLGNEEIKIKGLYECVSVNLDTNEILFEEADYDELKGYLEDLEYEGMDLKEARAKDLIEKALETVDGDVDRFIRIYALVVEKAGV